MKVLTYIILAIIALSFICKAQSDTLLIHFTNSKIEKIAMSNIQKIRFENLTSVDDATVSSKRLEIVGNSPNPFAEITNIEFEIKQEGNVLILIYNNRGEMIRVLQCNECSAGRNSIAWDGNDNLNMRVNTGLYYYEIRYNNQFETRKMLMIK